MRREQVQLSGSGGGLIPITRTVSWYGGVVPYYALGRTDGQQSFSSAFVVDVIRYVPFRMGINCGIDQMVWVQTVAAGAGGVVRVGLYRYNALGILELLFDSGSVAADGANGAKISNVNPVVRLNTTDLYMTAILAGTSAPSILAHDDQRAIATTGFFIGCDPNFLAAIGTQNSFMASNFSFAALPSTVQPTSATFNGAPYIYGRFTP